MFFSKIKTKIVATLLLVTILTAAIIGITSYIMFRGVLSKQAAEIGMESAKYNAEKIETWAKEKIASLERTAVHVSSLESFDKNIIQKMMNDAAKSDASFYSIFIGLENGKLIDAYGWVPPEIYDARDRPWYRLAIKANGTILTPAYLDKNKDKLVTSIALPIKLKGTNGVMAANIPLDQVLLQLKNIKYGKSGYGILIDNEGTVIVHKDKDNILRKLDQVIPELNSEILKSIQNNNSGVKTIELSNEKQLLVYVTIPSCDWKLLLFAPISDFLDPVRDLAKNQINITLFALFIMLAIGVSLGNTISEPIEKMILSIKKLAQGNLTEEIEIVGKDELATLGITLNQMRENHAKVIRTIQKEIKLLHSHAIKLTISVENISSGVTDFISQLSHDIKTPLTLIKGYTKGMQIGVAERQGKTSEYLAGIYARTEHIETITEEILDSIYDVRRTLVLENKKTLIEDLVKTFSDVAKWQIEDSNRVFIGEIDTGKGFIESDETKLLRVWNNLITNAIKYSEEGSVVRIGIHQNQKELVFSVEDQGIGIKEADIEKIFDMFYRVKEKDVKGYGIGLAISKALIEAHGGNLKVESSSRQSTKFTFNLPI